jgi:hypothetical protein
MGSITSRPWPPRPYKRFVVREQLVFRKNDNTYVSVSCEDYVWVRPGCEIPNGCGSENARNYLTGDPAAAQENAIRNLEDG